MTDAIVIRMADHRPVIQVALAICVSLDSPFRRDYPWASMGATLEDVYHGIVEAREGEQLLLPWAA